MISENVDLKAFNTFGIEAKAAHFATFDSADTLLSLLSMRKGQPLYILGGGSNILLTRDLDGWVLRNEITGFEVVEETLEHVRVKVGAGEVWHQFVLQCIERNYGGVENLSLIPGSVGASPMQNIGAYGVEIKDVFVELEAMQIETGEIRTFSKEECQFGYRESVFKRSLKGQYVILTVSFQLTKENHALKTSYGDIEKELATKGISQPTIKAISDAVISIRQRKLPDPKEIGNAGSFFKNPIVSKEAFLGLQARYPDIPNYPAPENKVKLAAGWLIEQAGWKGKTFGNYGVHKNQALVLVNYGNCTGKDILHLSDQIINAIRTQFGVELEREVNIL